jgi:hypothetical protein
VAKKEQIRTQVALQQTSADIDCNDCRRMLVRLIVFLLVLGTFVFVMACRNRVGL